MLTKNNGYQNRIETVMIENLVSEDHLIRKINKYINFSFIYDLVENWNKGSNCNKTSI
ncbi:hypothetical protein KVH43_02390 [Crassaminicella indica]|uniref:Transposase n=1 Tax=Crassaminicella indica TaxID=2855394 RepID=A0ABX8RC79_9CLOT|nr:hypothetical protein [Crassaminicella indica]QXM06618.1 hypothetical protein KVH43_02390 [Crassaminicella indica]